MGKSPAIAEPVDTPAPEVAAAPTLMAELRSSLMLLALFAAIVACTAILAFAASQG